MAQNKELKSQLAEMHEGFVGINEEKIRLTTQLEAERHNAKEAGLVLHAREDALQRLSVELEEKERRATEAEASLVEMEKRLSENDVFVRDMERKMAASTIERNRDEETTMHFGVNQRLVDTLQEELAGAQDAINALSGQNAELRSQVEALEADQAALTAAKQSLVVTEATNAAAAALSASAQRDEEINELLRQRDALANRYEDTEEKCKALRIQLETMRVHMEANSSIVALAEERRREEEEEEEVVSGEEKEEDAESQVEMNEIAGLKSGDESVKDEAAEGAKLTESPQEAQHVREAIVSEAM